MVNVSVQECKQHALHESMHTGNEVTDFVWTGSQFKDAGHDVR